MGDLNLIGFPNDSHHPLLSVHRFFRTKSNGPGFTLGVLNPENQRFPSGVHRRLHGGGIPNPHPMDRSNDIPRADAGPGCRPTLDHLVHHRGLRGIHLKTQFPQSLHLLISFWRDPESDDLATISIHLQQNLAVGSKKDALHHGPGPTGPTVRSLSINGQDPVPGQYPCFVRRRSRLHPADRGGPINHVGRNPANPTLNGAKHSKRQAGHRPREGSDDFGFRGGGR